MYIYVYIYLIVLIIFIVCVVFTNGQMNSLHLELNHLMTPDDVRTSASTTSTAAEGSCSCWKKRPDLVVCWWTLATCEREEAPLGVCPTGCF